MKSVRYQYVSLFEMAMGEGFWGVNIPTRKNANRDELSYMYNLTKSLYTPTNCHKIVL